LIIAWFRLLVLLSEVKDSKPLAIFCNCSPELAARPPTLWLKSQQLCQII